jgi:hypothetical protein
MGAQIIQFSLRVMAWRVRLCSVQDSAHGLPSPVWSRIATLALAAFTDGRGYAA